MQITEEKVIAAIREITGTKDEISHDTDLFREHILDSMSLIQLVFSISDTTGIEIPPADIDMEHWKTIGAIIAFLGSKTAA